MRREEIAAALAAATKDSEKGRARKVDVLAALKKLFPEQVSLHADALINSALMKEIGSEMRRIGNVDETNDDAPTVQLPLPGMPPPAYLMVRNAEGEEEAVRFLSVTPPDFNAAIDEREQQGNRILTKAADLRIKRAYLAPFMPADTDTVEDALVRMSPMKTAAE